MRISSNNNTTNIRLKVCRGSYDNDDAYENVLNYLMAKQFWAGYGFPSYEPCTVIESFRKSKSYSNHTSDRNIWHFVITFDRQWNPNVLYILANIITYHFSSQYQIVFAVDTESKTSSHTKKKSLNTHLHFAVNNYSYHPDTPTLTPEIMREYCISILAYLKQHIPGAHNTRLDFEINE